MEQTKILDAKIADVQREIWLKQNSLHNLLRDRFYAQAHSQPMLWLDTHNYPELSLADQYVLACILGQCCEEGNRELEFGLLPPWGISDDQLVKSLERLSKLELICAELRTILDRFHGPFSPYSVRLPLDLEEFKRLCEIYDNPHCGEDTRANGEITEYFTKPLTND